MGRRGEPGCDVGVIRDTIRRERKEPCEVLGGGHYADIGTGTWLFHVCEYPHKKNSTWYARAITVI